MSQLKICSKTQQLCTNTCQIKGSEICVDSKEEISDTSFSFQLQAAKWFRVKEIQEIYDVFEMVQDNTKYMILAGNTAQGMQLRLLC